MIPDVSDWMPGRTPRQAFQAAIDSLYGTAGGGMLTAPPGSFVFDAPVIHKGGVILQGAGRNGGTCINSAEADVPLWNFDATASRACLRDVFFIGRTERDATQSVVSIASNIQVFIRDCDIWGGDVALYNKGVDCRIRDCFISGNGLACLASNGANFYDHCKFDTVDPAKSPKWSVFIGTPTQVLQDAGAMENFFNVCDFSGPWQQGAVYIDDIQCTVGPISYNQFIGGVIAGNVVINRAKHSTFSSVRFGGASFTNGNSSVAVSGCTSTATMTLPTNVIRGSGNINISGGTAG